MGLSFSQAFGDYTVPHETIMNNAINTLGLSALGKCIPFDIEVVKSALQKGDEHLNTLSLKRWDAASGFVFSGSNMQQIPCGLAILFRQHGITAWSSAQGVCLLKATAKKLAERM